MKLKRCDLDTFNKLCNDKRICCYGIGGEFDRIINSYADYGWEKKISYLVDGDTNKVGVSKRVGNRDIKISSLDRWLEKDIKNSVLLLTTLAYPDVIKRLDSFEQLKGIDCYIFHHMFCLHDVDHDFDIKTTEKMFIPKVIHYCWFGKKELPDTYKYYIESWRRFCPDYEIMRWDESNCDIDETQYTKEAYAMGKYGFVPDYFRLKIIYENGGIYLDTDVEVIRNLDDLRHNKAFCGMQFPGEIALGLGFGAEKGNKFIKKTMDEYKDIQFITEKGNDETPSPERLKKQLSSLGINVSASYQNIMDLTVYPVEVLAPKSVHSGIIETTEKSYMIHHYDGTWLDTDKYKIREKRRADAKRIFDMLQLVSEKET